jgi:hypothetical protein
MKGTRRTYIHGGQRVRASARLAAPLKDEGRRALPHLDLRQPWRAVMRDHSSDAKQYLPPEYLWRARRPDTLHDLLDQQPDPRAEERPRLRRLAEEPCAPTFRPMPYARQRAAQHGLLESALRATKTVTQGT